MSQPGKRSQKIDCETRHTPEVYTAPTEAPYGLPREYDDDDDDENDGDEVTYNNTEVSSSGGRPPSDDDDDDKCFGGFHFSSSVIEQASSETTHGHQPFPSSGHQRFINQHNFSPLLKTSQIPTTPGPGCNSRLMSAGIPSASDLSHGDEWQDEEEDDWCTGTTYEEPVIPEPTLANYIQNSSMVSANFLASLERNKSAHQESNVWCKKLTVLWEQKQSDQRLLNSTLQECFNTVNNPYITAINLMQSAPDCSSAKSNTLCFAIVRELERWTRQNSHERSDLLDQQIRIQAFQTGIRYHMTCLDLITKAYQLNHTGNEYLLQYIRPILQRKRFKEVAQCVARLGLQKYFAVDEILVPLLLQDKVNLIETYVYQNAEQQYLLLSLLDELCDPSFDYRAFLSKYLDVKEIKHEKLQPKILSKLAIRLMKLYQLPPVACPNISNRRSLSAMKYMLYKRYIERTLVEDNWDELIEGTVGTNVWLQEQLVDELVTYVDIPQAVRWAQHFQLPQSRLPPQVIEALQEDNYSQHSSACCSGNSEDWSSDAQSAQQTAFHLLNLPMECIYIIDNRHNYQWAMQNITMTCSMLGIDSEWRPTFGQDYISGVALLQLATREAAFLFDIPALRRELTDRDWQELGRDIIANSDILKLGYGIATDLQMLGKTLPEIETHLANPSHLIDLHILQGQILREFGHEFFTGLKPTGETRPLSQLVVNSEERGLSELVMQCLGRPLDKREQMSDWQRRPLRQQQISYAALDAFCLLEVYEVLTREVTSRDPDFDLELQVTVVHAKSKMQRRQERVAEKANKETSQITKSQIEPPPFPDTPVSAPGELCVVVDNMLQGLGRYLRCCGVDVVMLDNSDSHDKAARIAHKEKRIILTSGAPFYTLRSQVPEGCCLNIPCGKARDQATSVLTYFNVRVTYKDIFSRCQSCNGNQYLMISAAEMKEAWGKKKRWQCLHPQGKPWWRTVVALPTSQSLPSQAADELAHINMEDLSIGHGVPVMLDSIPEAILNQVKVFYCCAKCGKVFWEGTHFNGVCEQFSHLLNSEEHEKETLYSPDPGTPV